MYLRNAEDVFIVVVCFLLSPPQTKHQKITLIVFLFLLDISEIFS